MPRFEIELAVANGGPIRTAGKVQSPGPLHVAADRAQQLGVERKCLQGMHADFHLLIVRVRSPVVGGQQAVIGFEHFGRGGPSDRQRPAKAIGGLSRVAQVGQRFAHRHERDRDLAAIAQFEFGEFPVAARFASFDGRILVFGAALDLPRLDSTLQHAARRPMLDGSFRARGR